MAHLYRFIGEKIDKDLWQLGADEAAHLKNVLRLKTGDQCEVMNGQGLWADGQVSEIHGKSAIIKTSSEHTDKENAQKIILALGALKPASLDELLPCIVELGVDSIELFLQSETAKSRINEKVQQRWTRIIQQSVKQCKRSFIPQITVFKSFDNWAADSLSMQDSLTYKITLDPLAKTSLIDRCGQASNKNILLIVGGEKGLQPNDTKLLGVHGVKGALIGHSVLRAYTAAISAVATATQTRN